MQNNKSEPAADLTKKKSLFAPITQYIPEIAKKLGTAGFGSGLALGSFYADFMRRGRISTSQRLFSGLSLGSVLGLGSLIVTTFGYHGVCFISNILKGKNDNKHLPSPFIESSQKSLPFIPEVAKYSSLTAASVVGSLFFVTRLLTIGLQQNIFFRLEKLL